MLKDKFYSVFKGKCPACHQGDIFESGAIYNPKKFDKMYEKCAHCGHKYEIENGFWYGAMYVSYGLTVAFSVATFVLTYLIYPDADAWLYFGLIVFVLLALVPITFRYSRLIWMNLFTSFNPNKIH
jgi:uncharacterized protein (DUF983 family)